MWASSQARGELSLFRSFPGAHLPSSRKKKRINLVVVPGTKTMPKPPLIVISDDEDDDDQHVEEKEPPPPKRFRRPTQVPQNFRCCESRAFRSTISPLRTHDVGPERESLKINSTCCMHANVCSVPHTAEKTLATPTLRRSVAKRSDVAPLTSALLGHQREKLSMSQEVTQICAKIGGIGQVT